MIIKSGFAKNSIRPIKVANNLHRELCEAMIKLSIHNASITQVQMNSDLSNAKIYCISNDNSMDDSGAAKYLNDNKQSMINLAKGRLSGRIIPSMKFYPDTNLRQEERVVQLLKNI
jgi:ribosome-binding factor A